MSTEPRKVRLSMVRRPDMTLVIPAADGTENEYTVRGQLTVEEVIEMYELQKSMAGVSDDDAMPMLLAIRDSQKYLTRLIRERYPDAPEVNLSLEEITMGFTAMIGGVTAAMKIAETLTDGLALGDEEEEVPEEAGDPTKLLSTLSSPPSSDSAATTNGGPNGGEASPGEPSPSTSEPITTA